MNKDIVLICMTKNECLNPQLCQVMAEIGHTDLFGVCDCGLPIPKSVERVDLAWKKGEPGWIEVCKMLKNNMAIEKIILADEIKAKSPDMLAAFEEVFSDVLIEFISHVDLKKRLPECKAIVRTGEATSFCNCIIVAGVDFW